MTDFISKEVSAKMAAYFSINAHLLGIFYVSVLNSPASAGELQKRMHNELDTICDSIVEGRLRGE